MIWKIKNLQSNQSLLVEADSFDEALKAARTIDKNYNMGQIVDVDINQIKDMNILLKKR